MINCNYKVKLKDIQTKYKFKIFNTGSYDDSDLRRMTESIFYALPRVTGSGTAITLDGTAFSYMKNKLNATDTTQETTTGANLQKFNARSTSSETYGYNYVCDEKGQVTITGTTTSSVGLGYNLQSTNPMTLTAGTYKLKVVGNKGNNTYIRTNGSEYVTLDSNQEATVTIPQDTTTFYIQIQLGSGTHNDNFYITLASGTTATTERYTGGIPQPNPDYPSEVQVIKGNNSIIVSNKNLINPNDMTLITGTIEGTTRYLWKINVKENTTYYIQRKALQTNSPYFRIVYCQPGQEQNLTNSNLVSGVNPITDTIKSFTTENQTGYVYYITDLSGTSNTNFSKNVFCLSTENIPFTEYQGQVKTLILGDKEICKIGNYEDKIFKAIKGNEIYDTLTTEEKNTLDYGKWYLRKNIGKVVLDENYDLTGIVRYTNKFLFQTTNALDIAGSGVKTNIFSDYFKIDTAIYDENNKVGFYAGSANKPYFAILYSTYGGNSTSSVATNLSLVKDWLSNNNVSVYYQLATPTNELFNDTVQDQLEDIYNNMLSYEGETNISQTNDGLPFNINSIALKDLNELIPQTANTLSSPLLRSVAPVIEEPIQEPTTERTETVTEEEPVEEETEPTEPIIEEPTER